ncbi:hypothetical protein ONZ45_g3725 [Pleurotus djamor]|nr:hypothetical protein ONZ45_g3725 [Pleurotus djamor]
MGKVQQHFFHATRVPPCRFTLRGWIFSCTATLTSANDEYSLVFPSAHFVAYTIPFTDVQSIETLDVIGYHLFDFLARVPRSRQYKYLKHIILPPYALCPKHKSIPAAKRWLKAWLPAESVGDVSVGGVKRQPLHDQDLVSLERAIPKVKRIRTGDMRVYYLK